MICTLIIWFSSREVLKHDPRSTIHTIHAIHTIHFISQRGRPVFRTISHNWMLGMSVICFCLQFFIRLVPIEEDRKKSFLPRLHWPIYVCSRCQTAAACIIEAVSQLLPNYESRTWDAKTRKLLSYQIVISGKIKYFRT